MTVNIDETTPALGSQYNYVKSSSKMIQWLFKEAKEGQVSAIQGDNDQYLVAALDKVYDGDYLPLEDPDVKKYCETQARNEKKGDALVKNMQAKRMISTAMRNCWASRCKRSAWAAECRRSSRRWADKCLMPKWAKFMVL